MTKIKNLAVWITIGLAIGLLAGFSLVPLLAPPP